MTKKRLSKTSQELLQDITDMGGLEVHDQYASLYRELEDAGLIDWSTYHGPGMKWRRGDCAMSEDTYPTPEHGWVCFHCGEHFPPHTLGAQQAREHFGPYIYSVPACQLWSGAKTWRSAYRMLLRKLRFLEKDNERLIREACEEDSAKDREIARMRSDHSQALMRAEEEGYAKGLRDGRL